ncbi:sulfur carrier protein ThiS adenylyltransferase ThiF [Pseudodesulfovibrio sp. JC047]|uniref:sulfur carrier protein ThiS adenylyltransferase ThiF n=1 Tax=Pseudodesulfovibrio sp. JC047 TaxID=2683199 RepID=UPI0013D88F57|nr:sulfur carrier protein ThiS adenylyltransferase ThiF [Pseudodesulfovibrio sp. JC047]NDV18955.1 sulfur carrier protein ThiS adenylyltransferase ThiF [Pseudodesulfovibrio sp. JC047]
MNLTEQGIASYLGEDRLRYLQTVSVGIAGAGGLGSNCAMHLVRSGFRRFVLVDFDRIEPSNLNRQAFTLEQVGANKVDALAANMHAVNPDLELDLYIGKVNGADMAELFAPCHVIVEAFDDPTAKKALVETMLPSKKLVVAVSGMGGFGKSDAIITRKVSDSLYLIGDGETECSDETPPMSPRVGIAAAKQADVVLRYFLDRFATEGEK